MRDDNIARKVAESLTGHGGYKDVVEIGPGTGALSKWLIGNAGFRWTGIEIDAESVAFLREKYPEAASSLIRCDFLTTDIHELMGDKPFAVIGNFPYNISSQILFKVLEGRHQIPELVGMFQKEVAARIATAPGSKTYGILSVLTQAFYDTSMLFQVDEHVFDPPPNVKSAVIRMKRKENFHLDCNEKKFFLVVKTAFNQRRKTLRNALKSLAVDWSGLPSHYAGERAEQMHVADFVNITNKLIIIGNKAG